MCYLLWITFTVFFYIRLSSLNRDLFLLFSQKESLSHSSSPNLYKYIVFIHKIIISVKMDENMLAVVSNTNIIISYKQTKIDSIVSMNFNCIFFLPSKIKIKINTVTENQFDTVNAWTPFNSIQFIWLFLFLFFFILTFMCKHFHASKPSKPSSRQKKAI